MNRKISPNLRVVHGGRGRYLNQTDTKILDFSASLNPVPPPLNLTISNEQVSSYPDDSYQSIKEIIARYHHRKADEITIGSGSVSILRTLAHTTLSPSTIASIPDHTFGEYALSARLAGSTVVSGDQKADLTFLCNPDNPSGVLTKREEVISKLGSIAEFGGILCVDEAFMDLADPQESVSAVQNEHLFILRSVTKSFAIPGIRFGYGIGPADLVQDLEIMRAPWLIGALEEQVAMQIFSRMDQLEESRNYIRKERNRMILNIKNAGYQVSDSTANYILIETRRSSAEVTELLLKQGILVRDCESFGLPSSIRVAVRRFEENNRFLEAFSSCLY